MEFPIVIEPDEENPDIGDIRLDGGDVAPLVEGAQAAQQDVLFRLSWWVGEWFLDLRKGVPYIQRVFVKGPSRRAIEAMFRQVIQGSRYIQVVHRLSLRFSPDRRAEVTYDAQAITGEPLRADSMVIEPPTGGPA